MLSDVLDKETCKNCRFCCEFEKADEWEIPIVSKNVAEHLKNKGVKVVKVNENYTFDLEFEGKEIKKCPFLSENGCVLDEENKPFDCKIWPLRVMKKDNKIYLTLAKTCPAFEKDDEKIIKLSLKLFEKISNYAKQNKGAIKEYSPDYKIIKEIK